MNTITQETQNPIEAPPFSPKEEALDTLQREVSELKATLDCCHSMLEIVLARLDIEVVKEAKDGN